MRLDRAPHHPKVAAQVRPRRWSEGRAPRDASYRVRGAPVLRDPLDMPVSALLPALARFDVQVPTTAIPLETPTAILTVISGRPGTGKTTLAKALARRRRSCYLRVDVAEAALARTGVQVGVEGYAVIRELAISNLLLGIDVIVDAVNAVPEVRAGWREAVDRGEAELLQVETWLTDPVEHRRRVNARKADIPGHRVPSWDQVESQPWIPWDEKRDGARTLIETTDSRQALAELLAITSFA